MIAQTDRIMVMEGGRIVEFDTPLTLLENPRSKLSLMVSQTGDIDQRKLLQIALARAEANRKAMTVNNVTTSKSGKNDTRIITNSQAEPSSSEANNVSNTYGTTGDSSSKTTVMPRSLKQIFDKEGLQS
jgi:ABC-type proline/glycine betaine transport system ATPase subunit